MPAVEVIWPGDAPSPIDHVLKRGGPMVYHLCYVTVSPVISIRAMEAEGFNIIAHGDPKPAVLFGGQYVSFYSVANVGLVELIHGDTPATELTRGES
jgi:hypothetical protein